MDDIIQGDALTVLKTLPDGCVQTCVTSPPYFGLRDYGMEGQIGLEETPDAYVQKLVEVFREVRRVLRDDGTLWLNLGDSYAANQSNNGGYSDKSTLAGFTSPDTKGRRPNDATSPRKIIHGLKPKDLIGIPWRVAFALQADGWYLRQDIIWHKPNPMPESVTDRCTKAHEYLFLLSKSDRYYFDHEAIKEPTVTQEGRPSGIVRDRVYQYDSKLAKLGRPRGGEAGDEPETRNRRSVWTVATKPYKGAHCAAFPPDLIKPCIKAGAPPNYTVLDPFFGSGTTGMVAKQLGRHFLGIELNPDYITLAEERINGVLPPQPTLMAAE